MRRAFWLSLLLSGTICCFVRLDAPCVSDDYCPETQYCLAGHCRDGPVDPLSACQRAAQALTQRASQCGYGPADLLYLNYNGDAGCRSIASSVDADRIQYNSTLLGACYSNLSDAGCSWLSLDAIGSSCSALQPRQLQGQLCASSNDCLSGWCDTTAGCEGQCRPLIAVGNSCGTSDRCEIGAACVGATCVLDGVADAGCNLLNLGAAPCDISLYFCDLSAGKCSPRQTDGPCNTLVCLDPETCPCDLHDKCVDRGLGGRCEPALGPDAGCDTGKSECEPLLVCSSGANPVCVPESSQGASCGYPAGEIAGCLNSRCLSGTCSAFLNPGDSCSASTDCGPTAHCDGVCKLDVCI